MSETEAKEKFSFIEMLGKHPGAAAIIGGIAVVSVWGFYLWQFRFGLSDSQETWGQFGDFVGGTLNSVFGFLGFLILLSSLRLQAKELAEASKELKASSEAQSAQARYLDREEKRRYHADAIEYIVKNKLIGDIHNVKIGITQIHSDSSSITTLLPITSPNTPRRTDIEGQGILIDERELSKLEKLVSRIKFLDEHCFGLWDSFPISPILFDPISIYDRPISILIEKGWITDLKFFGKQDFPLR